MKTLTLIVLRPPLMAAHGLVMLASQPRSRHAARPGEPDSETRLAAISRADAACRDREQALRIRQAMPNASPAARSGLLRDPLDQVRTFGIALRLDPDCPDDVRRETVGPCLLTITFGVPAAGLARLQGLCDRAMPIGLDLLTEIESGLGSGGGDRDAVGRLRRTLADATGQICAAIADLEPARRDEGVAA